MSPSSSYDDFPSLPSMPTVRAGDARDALGRIDHYDLLRKLGGGGFGVVYLARDTASGVEVALKTLHPLLKANAEEMDALREKFRLVHALTHPNIAKALVLHPVRDVNVWDEAARQELRLSPGDSVMVMDYAPGVTLSKWRRQFSGRASRPGEPRLGRDASPHLNGEPTVPLPLVLEIGRQLASALDYAHGERIVHRDVKPSNVMVETLPEEASPPSRSKEEVRSTKDEGQISPTTDQLANSSTNQLANSKIRARILDFGLAAEIRSSMSRVSTETGDTSGTRPYMAPEQWAGQRQDGRTDQYALACVLYELLSGAPPFAGVFETGDPVIMMATVKGEAPEEIVGVPLYVNAALQKALAKDPKERFSSCAAFMAALAASANPESRSLGRIPTPETRTPQAAPLGAALIAPAFVICPLCGKKNDPKDTFLCRGCGRDNLCLRHQDEATFLCADCAGKAREEAERKAHEEAVRKAHEEAARKAREEAERKAREEAERKAREEMVRKSREAAQRKEMEKAGMRKVIRVCGTDLALRYCPPGTFLMGSPPSEEGHFDDETQHRVTLTRGFWLGETPVTQGQWECVMGSNPSYHLDKKGWLGLGGRATSPMRPVETVSWDDCQTFIGKLNARAEVCGSGLRFALPTEAQWEYACRAGTTGDYGGTGRLDDMGWYADNSGGTTHPVGEKEPNAWGLRDMHGNVYEWCADWYGDYPSGAVTDPTGPASGGNRVLRGGSSWDDPQGCRSADRLSIRPSDCDGSCGLRLLALQDAP